MSSFRVEATALNIRSEPFVKPSTRIATLPQGHEVKKLADAEIEMWWEVSTSINGVPITGFVNSAFLRPVADYIVPPASGVIEPLHMVTNRAIKRSETGGWEFPLNEKGQPGRTSPTAPGKASDLHRIIKWLAVDVSVRYLPARGKTYCNIYAYDYCYLAGAYLPRVWWNSKAIASIQAGTAVVPLIGQTVNEVSANGLHKWLSEYGEDFGWRRTVDLNELQNQANKGAVCLMSAKRRESNLSGHICAVVPETENHRAVRVGNNVTMPLQTNAGATNFQYGGRIWWTAEKFSSFSFWIHQ